MGCEPYLCRVSHVWLLYRLVLHVLVNRISDITGPEGLDSPDTAIRTYIASEATAGDHLTQTIDVCTIR